MSTEPDPKDRDAQKASSDDLDLEEAEDQEELDDEEGDEEPLAEEEGGPTSLEELVAQRSGSRRPADEAEEETDIMALKPDRPEPIADPIPGRIAPVEEGKEFVCNRCRLVKQRVQLADRERGLCRDCV